MKAGCNCSFVEAPVCKCGSKEGLHMVEDGSSPTCEHWGWICEKCQVEQIHKEDLLLIGKLTEEIVELRVQVEDLEKHISMLEHKRG